MYKSTSTNSQRRTVARASNSTANSAGVDPSSFANDKHQAWLDARDRKRGLETKLTELNAMIKDAKSRYSGVIKGGIVNYSTVVGWERARAKLVHEIKQLDGELATFNIQKGLSRDADARSFERVFIRTARDMLAPDVFNRILIAATHYRADE